MMNEFAKSPLLLVSWFPGCADGRVLRLLKSEGGIDGVEVRYLDEEAAFIRDAGCLVSFHLPTLPGEELRGNLCDKNLLVPFQTGRMGKLALSDIGFLGFHLGYSCMKAEKVAGGPDRPLSATLSRGETFTRIAKTLIELRELTQREILVENMDYGPAGALEYVCDVGFMRELCEATGCGVIWDIAHAMVSAEPLGLCVEAYMDSFIQELAPFIKEVHVNSAHEGKDAHFPAGEAELGWLRKLLGAGANPTAVSLERHWGDQSGYDFAAVLVPELRMLRQIIAAFVGRRPQKQ